MNFASTVEIQGYVRFQLYIPITNLNWKTKILNIILKEKRELKNDARELTMQ